MRIDLNRGPEPPTESGPGNAQTRAATNRSSWGVGEDQTQLSGARVQVEALGAQAALQPEMRQERVSALRQAVANRQYQTNPESVAGALFDHMRALSFA